MNYQQAKKAYENGEATNMSDFEFDKLEAAETGRSDVVDFGKLPRTRGCKTYNVDVAVDYIMEHGFAVLMPKYDGIYVKITFAHCGFVDKVLTKEGNDITDWFDRCSLCGYSGRPNSTITAELLPANREFTRADLVRALNAKTSITVAVYNHLDFMAHKVVFANLGRERVKHILLNFESRETRADGIAIYAEKKPFYFKF